jgi:hypothetical protein
MSAPPKGSEEAWIIDSDDETGDSPAVGPVPDIAPIERFIAPPGLDGRSGTHRCVDPCLIDAATDQEAIAYWVFQDSACEQTAHARRAAAEKLLNWACFARKKAVSSLDEEDFGAFARFLASPAPRQQWIGARRARSSPDWRPFARPLSSSSQGTTLRQITALVSWLASKRYANLRFIYGKKAMASGLATTHVRGTMYPTESRSRLTVAEWQWVRRLLDARYPVSDMAPQRLVVELLFFGNLYAEEICNLRFVDLEPASPSMQCWSIWVRDRPIWRGGATVYCPPPLSRTLDRWIGQTEVDRRGHVVFRIRGSPEPMLKLSHTKISSQARNVLGEAAALAEEGGDSESALSLSQRSVVDLRGAFDELRFGRVIDWQAIRLTGETLRYGLGWRRKGPKNWGWRGAEHLWDGEASADAADSVYSGGPHELKLPVERLETPRSTLTRAGPTAFPQDTPFPLKYRDHLAYVAAIRSYRRLRRFITRHVIPHADARIRKLLRLSPRQRALALAHDPGNVDAWAVAIWSEDLERDVRFRLWGASLDEYAGTSSGFLDRSAVAMEFDVVVQHGPMGRRQARWLLEHATLAVLKHRFNQARAIAAAMAAAGDATCSSDLIGRSQLTVSGEISSSRVQFAFTDDAPHEPLAARQLRSKSVRKNAQAMLRRARQEELASCCSGRCLRFCWREGWLAADSSKPTLDTIGSIKRHRLFVQGRPHFVLFRTITGWCARMEAAPIEAHGAQPCDAIGALRHAYTQHHKMYPNVAATGGDPRAG